MPIPSPADFRNKTKKHSEVREMFAQMAESVQDKSKTALSYLSLSEANTDIANIPLGVSVKVLSAENGGEYYKSTSSATSLTKSPSDPLTQANANLTNVCKVPLNYTKKINYVLDQTGSEVTWANAFVSNALSVTGVARILVESLKAISAKTCVVAFYDSNGAAISESLILLNASTSLATTNVINVPSNATTMKIAGDNTVSQPKLYKIVYVNELLEKVDSNKTAAESLIANEAENIYKSQRVDFPFSLTAGDYRIATDGSLANWGGMKTSAKLPISILTENSVVIENLSTPATATLIIAFYSVSDVFISGISAANSTVVAKTTNITVPANASYFRICYNGANSVAKIYKVLGAQNLLTEVEKKSAVIEKSAKVKMLTPLVSGNYAINTDGTLLGWGGMLTSQPISLSGIKYISAENLSARSNGGYAIAFYDVSNALITTNSLMLTANQIVSSTGLIEVPQNAVTFRYCYNSTLTTASVYAVSTQYAYDLLKSEMLAIAKPYAGKKILSLGDSYTWLNYYGSALAETTGCTQRARGQNGNVLKSFCNDSYTGTDGNLVTETFDAALLSQYDIVTIMGGTNDYGHGSATLGAISDTKDQNTIYGSIKFLIDKILSLKPTIKIVFVTQPFRLQYSTETSPGGYLPNSNGLTMQNIAQAIKECAGLYGCSVYDFYSLSGWNEFTIKKNEAGNFNDNIYTYDGLHPRQGIGNGGDLLGKGLGRFITRL